MKFTGTISQKEWNEDAIIRVFENLDGTELYIGREVGRKGFRHYQFCMDCAGDLEQYTLKNHTGWHVERCGSWDGSVAYCRKTNNYLYRGNSIEERYYSWIKSRGSLRIWTAFGCSAVRQDDRQITVWADTDGKSAKSTFCYLVERRGKCLNIPSGESPQRIIEYVAMHYNGEPLICVDIPREQKVTKNLVRALETLKDGSLHTSKYQGVKKYIKGVKILVFTNHFIDPDLYKNLTKDRWDVRSVAKWKEAQDGDISR